MDVYVDCQHTGGFSSGIAQTLKCYCHGIHVKNPLKACENNIILAVENLLMFIAEFDAWNSFGNLFF